MTDEEIARSTLYRLHVLSDRPLTQEQFDDQALAIIADAVLAGRREGESSGITTGTRYACEVQTFVLDRCLLRPISAAEIAKADEWPG